MNKTWIAVLTGAVLISMVGIGIQHISAKPDDAQLTSTEIREMVEDKYPGQITELELDRKNGQLIYEVELKGPEGEYEIKVDASTAEIVKLEQKPNKVSKGEHDDNRKDDEADDASSEGGARMSIDEAKEIALNEIPGTIVEVELDREDGLLVYEVEIQTEDGEVEVEVDAYTGKIVMISWDD